MKQTTIKLFSALTAAVLATFSVHAGGTDTWGGNTDANWSTAANWTTVGGGTPPANGDSLVFGSAGTSGLTLNNNLSGLSVNNLNLNGPGAFIFSGNVLSLYGTLTDAASVNETFGGINIGAGGFAAIKNTGSGTLYLGALTRTAGSGGAVNFTATGTINTTTTTNSSNNILGGWATVGNAGTSGATADWATVDGSGNIITYSGYTSISAATSGSGASAQNWKVVNASGSITSSGIVNSLVETTDFSISSGATMTLGSGGLILSGQSRWLKNNGNGNTSGTGQLTSGLGGGELFVDSSASGGSGDNDWRIWPKIVDNGSTPVIFVKTGPGYVRLENANTYSGGTILNSGTVFLSNNNAAGGNNALGTNTVTLNGGTLNLDSATLANNFVIPAGASAVIDNSANNGTLNGSFAGAGTLTLQNSSGNGLSEFISSGWTNFTGTLNYNCSAGGSKNFNCFAPANLNLSNVTVNFTNTAGNAGSTWRGNTTCLFGSLGGPSGFLDTGCTYLIGYLNTSTTFGGVVLGTSVITKVGIGALTLSGASSYSGTTTVENGSLVAGANAPASANGPFGNSSSAIALGDAASISSNLSPSLLIGGNYTVSRQVTVGANNTATTGIYALGGSTANSATFAGNITLNQNLVVTQATGGTLTISGAIGTGSFNLTKVGGGIAILSGPNSYTSSTIVNNGVLMVGNTTEGNGPVTVADGAGAGVNASSDTTYWSPSSLTVGTSTGGTLQFGVVGTSSTLLTPGTLTLNGTTTINISSCPQVLGVYPLFNGYSSGTLVLGSQPAGLLGKITVSGSTVNYQLTNFVSDVWTAAVNTNWDTVAANWTNTIGGNKYISGYPVVFDDTAVGAGPLLVNIANPVTPNSINVNNTNKAYVIGGLAIGGATGLTKTGNNSLTLTGTNTFTGAIAVSGGTVEIGGAGQLGSGTYAATIQDDVTFKVNTTAAQTLSGSILGNGALVKDNTGTLSLPVANALFTGPVTNNNGILQVSDGGALGSGTLTLNGGTLQNNANITMANNIDVSAASAITSVSQNLNLNGNLTGSGNITYTEPGNASTLALGGDDSGYSGTFTISGANAAFQWATASAGSANATWVLNNNFGSGGRMRFSGGWSGSIDIGALSGSGIGLVNNNSGTVTMNVGALNTSTVFSGTMISGPGVIALTKVGTGSLTLSGASSHTGQTTVQNGSLIAGAAALASANGPFGNSAGALALGDFTSLGSSFNASLLINGPYTVGRAITVGAAPGANSSTYTIGGIADTNATFSGNIALNQSLSVSNVVSTTNNALTISGAISSLDGANPSVTFGGPGNIMLTAANTYSGNTIISGGRLILSGSGGLASANINVGSGAVFDVSGVTYTLGGSQTLSGTGSITGAVATASSGSSISPATNGMVGALTFSNNLNLSGGATLYFDLSTSHVSGNDQIAVGGNLTVGSSDAVHVNALSGAANLDQAADYVLMTCAGTTTMSGQPLLLFDNTPPANAGHYSVQKVGNNVVLHYSATASPTVTSVIATNTADGSTTAARYQTVTVYATVSPGAGSITSVTANLTSIGGSAAQAMSNLGGNNYAYTATVGAGAQVGSDVITVTATDSLSHSGANSATLTVTAGTVTWDGLAADNTWGNGNNWVGNNPPGFTGDSVIFTGSTQTTADMNGNYAVAALTFDGGASSFTITNPAGTALTLNGTLENDSGSPQTLTTPIVLASSQTINDAGNAGITLAGAISGAGALTVGSGYVTLAGSNSYSADTTVNGTLKTGNSAAIPSGTGKGNVLLAGTLDLNGTNASINNLLGGAGTVDNTSATSASTLTIGNNNDVINLTGVTVQNSGGTNLALAKVGTGDLTMSSANTFSGGLIISNGTALLGNNNAAGTGTITLAGGTLENIVNSLTLPNNIDVTASSSLLIGSGLNWNLNGSLTGTGNITYSPVNFAATLQISGDNSGYSGTFTINGANAAFQWASASAGSANATWVLNNTWGGGTRMRFSGGWSGTIDLGALSGNGIGLVNNNAGTVTMSVGALNTSTLFSGTITSQGSGGPIALTKVGAGTLTLSGANTYTGPTIVSNGTLVITTAHAGNGDFAVNDGKKLGVINNGGSQTALLNSLTLGDTAGPTTLFFTNVASTTAPVITVAGGVTKNGTCNIAISNSIVNSGSVYPLVKYGSLAGAGNFVLSSVPSGVTATLTNDTSNLWIALNVSVGNNVNTDPATANFSATLTGQTLNFSWADDHHGWQLYTNAVGLNATGSWYPVPGSANGTSQSITVDPTKPNVFFQLRYP